MTFWKVDLTTRDGAENAATTGGYACFITAVLALLGAAMLYYTTSDHAAALDAAVGAIIEAVIFFVAGLRLRAGKGAYWSIVAAALLALEFIMKMVGLSFGGLLIDAVLLIVIVNGARGAWTLRRNDFPEELGEVFE